MANSFKEGDTVILKGNHPWKGSEAILLSYKTYGPAIAGLEGWLVQIQLPPGQRCYAGENQMRRVRSCKA